MPVVRKIPKSDTWTVDAEGETFGVFDTPQEAAEYMRKRFATKKEAENEASDD